MAIEQSGSGGFGKWQGGPMFTRARQYGVGQTNGTPSGRRKTRGFNAMRREAADAVKKYSVVLACSDQFRSQGSGIAGKAQGMIGNDWRKQGLDGLVEYARENVS